jgi:ParB-like chromosome segregation protein Spo0J
MTTVGPQTPIMLAQITPNMNQPRQTFDHGQMLELALSIRSGGLVQPIVIQPGDNYHPEGKFD